MLGVFFFEGGTCWRVNGGIVYFYVLMAYSVDPPKKDNLVDNLRDIL